MTSSIPSPLVGCRVAVPALALYFSAAEAAMEEPHDVQVFGALRAMFHEGQTGSMVTLDTMLPNPHL